ncbi:MAG: cell division protein FtsX [Hyphomonadaceae bacterium]
MSRSIPRETPLLPTDSAREAALFFVVCALCFLAALATLSAKATYGAAAGWTSQVEGQLTIRLRGADMRAAEEARTLIEQTEGILAARIITREEMEDMLAPRFGSGGLPAGLPLPLMIDVEADPLVADIGPTLARHLTEAGFASIVDEHADWAGDVRRSLGAVRLAAFSAVALLIATALAVIAFATHAALLARQDIVDVLHFTGAEDRYIANLFERRFWLLGLRGGAIGALAALGGVALLIFSAQSAGPGNWLLPRLSLDFWDMMILVLTPVVAGFAARFAARLTVMRALAVAG